VGHFGETFREHVIDVMHMSLGLKHRSALVPPASVGGRNFLYPPIVLLVVPCVAHTDAYVFSLRVLVDPPGQVTDMSHYAFPTVSVQGISLSHEHESDYSCRLLLLVATA
jgi:hypothetical protein